MPILKDLITDSIRNSDYYKKYMEMAAYKPCQPTTMTGEEVEMKKKASKAGKRYDHLVSEEDEKGQPTSEPQVRQAPICGVSIHEPDSAITRILPDVKGMGKVSGKSQRSKVSRINTYFKGGLQSLRMHLLNEYNLQRGIQMSLESLQAQGQLTITTRSAKSHKMQVSRINTIIQRLGSTSLRFASTGPSATTPQDDTSTNVVHDISSPADSTNYAETAADMEQSNMEMDTEILNVVEERGEEVSNTVALEERTVEFDEGQTGSNPAKTPESQPPPKLELKEEDQAGSDPG
ncbi:hypothetical protein Tco_1469761 [Tanacetum coccineum]